MTNQVDQLLDEMNFTARKRLLCNEPAASPPPGIVEQQKSAYQQYLKEKAQQMGLHVTCHDVPVNLNDIPAGELERIINFIRSEWPWPVCKAAFPHDVDAATRLYQRIHGEDPPYMEGM